MATVTLDPNTSYQTIIGWEGVAQTGLGDFLTSGQNYHDEVLDAVVDLGINRLRCEIHSGHIENTTDYWGNYVADGRDEGTNAEEAAMSANRRIPINDDADPNTITASGFKFTAIDWQIDNYVTPLKTKLAARGETLFWQLCYVHFSLTDQLHVDTPAEYGELILAIWQHISATYGSAYLPDALEIFLEPDNGTTQVTTSEMAAMIQAARDRLVNAGFAKPYIVAPSTVTSPATLAYYQGIETANATAFSYIDECSRHRYGTQPDDGALAALAAAVEADGKNLSMLETGAGVASGGNSAIALHQDLKVSHVSAWAQFALGFPSAVDNANKYFLVGGSPTYTVTESLYAKYLRHYFYAIRRGAVMKGVSVGGTGAANIDALPFRNANGTYTVVAKCSAAVDFDISGLPNGTYEVRYTTGDGTSAPSAYWQSLTDEVVTAGSTGTISMPGAGWVTVYDQNYLTNTGYQLYVSKNGGTFSLLGTEVTPFDSTNLTDGAVTTTRLTGGEGTFIAGEVSEDGSADDFTITAGDHTEFLFSLTLQASLLANADTLDFRVYYNGQPVGAYGVTPRLTITQAVGYTLTAEAGSFSYTGHDANLLRGLRLGAETGTFSYTGQDAGLFKGWRLEAEASDFSYMGADVGLFKGWRLGAETGAFTYSGQDANLLKGWRLNAETGTFTYSGSDATLIHTPVGGYTLTAETGTFTYTGADANLLKGWRLDAQTGVFSYTGNDATLIYSPVGSYTLTADVGVFSYSGGAANLLKGWRLNAETGTFTYTGQNANLLKGWRLNAETGTFTYTGNTANLLRGLKLIAETGVFSYAGADATLIYSPVGSYTLAANAGVFPYTGNTANLLKGWRLLAETGSFTYSGQNANLIKGYRLLAETGTFSYAGTVTALQWVRYLIAQGATFTYSGGQVVLTHAGFVVPLPAPLTMILDLHERSMALDLNELSMMLED